MCNEFCYCEGLLRFIADFGEIYAPLLHEGQTINRPWMHKSYIRFYSFLVIIYETFRHCKNEDDNLRTPDLQLIASTCRQSDRSDESKCNHERKHETEELKVRFRSQCDSQFTHNNGQIQGQSACAFCVISFLTYFRHSPEKAIPPLMSIETANKLVAYGVAEYIDFLQNLNRDIRSPDDHKIPGYTPNVEEVIDFSGDKFGVASAENFNQGILPYSWIRQAGNDGGFSGGSVSFLIEYIIKSTATHFMIFLGGGAYGLLKDGRPVADANLCKCIFIDSHSRSPSGNKEPDFTIGKGHASIQSLGNLVDTLENACGKKRQQWGTLEVNPLTFQPIETTDLKQDTDFPNAGKHPFYNNP